MSFGRSLKITINDPYLAVFGVPETALSVPKQTPPKNPPRTFFGPRSRETVLFFGPNFVSGQLVSGMVESISVCYKSGECSVTAPVRRLPLLQTSCHCAGWRRGFGDGLVKMVMVKIKIFKRHVLQFWEIMVWDVIRVWMVRCNQAKTRNWYLWKACFAISIYHGMRCNQGVDGGV